MRISCISFAVTHDRWHPPSLCLRYFSAHFERWQVKVLVDGGMRANQLVTWAVGVLADGDWEALGVWPGAACDPEYWRGVWEDLGSLGVEKISLVCASDLDAWTLCPGVKVLPPFQLILGQGHVSAASRVGVLRAEARRLVREASGARAARIALERLVVGSGSGRAAVLAPDWPEVLEQLRPFYALRPHRRALVRVGDEYLEQLGSMLARAVRRHGPFADLPAAVSFVALTLARCQARIERAELPPLPFPSHPVGRAVARAAVRAAGRSELAVLASASSV